MRRALCKHPSKTIGITLATVFMAGALFCAGFILDPSSKGKEPEEEITTTDNNSAPEQKEQTQKITITTPEEPTLNHQERKTTISASRQSSLERAVDDLIILTESDG